MLKAAIRDSLVYGLASILTKGLAIFLLPLYTHVLSTGDYGVYDLLVTAAAAANLVVALEISQGLARFWPEVSGAAEQRKLASTALWFTAVMYGIFMVASLLVAPWLTERLLDNADYLGAFRLGVGFIAVNGIYYLLLNQFRWELRSKAYALVSCCCAALTLIFSAIFCLWHDMGLEGVMLSQLLASLVASLLSFWLLRTSFNFVFISDYLVAMLKFSMPLVPAGLAVFVSLYINRFALNHFGTLEDVGLFGIGSRIAGLSGLLILGIQAALTPLIYQNHQNVETPWHIARLFGWFSAIALSGCLFLTLFARELLMIFATPEFIGGASLVGFMAPALLLSQMYIFAPGIAIHKKTILQLWVTLASAVVSVLGNWVLVPLYGVYGAAAATLLAATVFMGCWLYLSQRLYHIPYAWRAILISLLVFVGCALAGTLLDEAKLSFVQIVVGKFLLLAAMLGVVVMVRLLSISDLKALVRRKAAVT